jgi:hypothetical protein
LLRPLGAVLRTTLSALRDTHGIENTTNDVVANTGEVLYAAPADEHHRVLLKVVTLTGNIRGHLDAVGQPNTRHLAKS